MQYDYFYGAQAEQFSFYRIPKALFTDTQFKDLSTDAKVLYGILLDRMSLSLKNHWLDEQNRLWDAELALLAQQQTQLNNMAGIYRALGGSDRT